MTGTPPARMAPPPARRPCTGGRAGRPVGLDHHRLPPAPPLRPGPGRLPQRYGVGDGGLPGHRSASPPAGRACTPRWVSRPPRASSVEVARRMIATASRARTSRSSTPHHLTCEGLAPDGTAAVADGGQRRPDRARRPLRPARLRDRGTRRHAQRLRPARQRPPPGRRSGRRPVHLHAPAGRPHAGPARRSSASALRTGLVDLADAATEDESGAKGGLPPVSSAQEMATAVSSLVRGAAPASPTRSAPTGSVSPSVPLRQTTLKAPLRFMVDGRGQVQSDDTVDVGAASTTTLAIDVVTATARARTSRGHRHVVDRDRRPRRSFAGKRLRAGVGAGTTQASGSSAALERRRRHDVRQHRRAAGDEPLDHGRAGRLDHGGHRPARAGRRDAADRLLRPRDRLLGRHGRRAAGTRGDAGEVPRRGPRRPRRRGRQRPRRRGPAQHGSRRRTGLGPAHRLGPRRRGERPRRPDRTHLRPAHPARRRHRDQCDRPRGRPRDPDRRRRPDGSRGRRATVPPPR